MSAFRRLSDRAGTYSAEFIDTFPKNGTPHWDCVYVAALFRARRVSLVSDAGAVLFPRARVADLISDRMTGRDLNKRTEFNSAGISDQHQLVRQKIIIGVHMRNRAVRSL